jgi:hypothetical protein
MVFDAEQALELQSYLGRRLQESKTAATAEQIERAMADLCADILAQLGHWVKVGKRASFGEGCVLYWVEQYWNDLTPLHAQYDSFDDFAVQETGEDYSTYRTKINIYKTFIINERNDPMVAEHGPNAFLEVPVGKLQKALGAVRKGRMTQEQWDALMDPNVGDRQFHHVMKALPTGATEEDQEDRFIQEGSGPEVTVSMADGALLLWPGRGQVGVKIGYLEVRSKNDVVREAVDNIVEAAGIRRV